MSATAALIASTLNAGTPLLLAGIGILIHERSGVLNLGIEGIMLMGAVAGFGICYLTGSFSWALPRRLWSEWCFRRFSVF